MDEHFIGPNWAQEHLADQKEDWRKLWQWQALRWTGGLRLILTRTVRIPQLHVPPEM